MTLVSQYDVELLLAIETHMGSKLEPLEPEEAQVLEMLHDVASARRVGNWVELVGTYRDADNRPCGGWMMVDGRDKGLGLLLRRLDGAEAFAAKLQQVKRDALDDALSPANQERYDVRAEIEAARTS